MSDDDRFERVEVASVRRNILRWIAYAKTAPTREKRITLTATLAQRGEQVRSSG